MFSIIRERKKNNTDFFRIGAIMTALSAALLGLILLHLLTVPNRSVYQDRQVSGLIMLLPASRQERPEPNAPLGVAVEYRFDLPGISVHDPYFVFYVTHQYARVYLGDELLYAIEYPRENGFGNTVGDCWIQVPLYLEDSGKQIRVELLPVYESSREVIPEFLMGSLLDIYARQQKRELPQILLSLMTILTGALYIVAGICMRDLWGKSESVRMLGYFSLLLGVWKLTDCICMAYLFPERTALLHYLSLSCLMLAPMPLIRLVRVVQKHQRIMAWYGLLAAAVMLGQVLLQISGILDLRQMLTVTHGVIVAGTCCILIGQLKNRRYFRHRVSERRQLRLLFLCLGGAVVDVLLFHLTGTSTGLFFSLLTLLVYVLLMGILAIREYFDQENLLHSQEKELTERRIAVMVSQIQPHFIYNTLGTIRYLCMTDPEKAADVVQTFSMYLRGNLGEINNHAPIRISREMEHVQHYTAIEKMRFPDMEIEFDLRSGEFFLPALSVQPLVENAIKHGLMKLETGGRVVVATYETETDYQVSVTDDGVGFDINKQIDPDKHIGIHNIRKRLESMCGGTLEIESVPGKGTVAMIRIPKEETL